jgi:hypothetical protein
MPGAWCVRGHLVTGAAFCHFQAMQDRRTPAAGGIFLFLGPVIGALYGIGRGEPILWMLYGFGIGVALAVIIWLVDKRKR